MVTDILNKMAEVVANTMTSFQSDFTKYDAEYVKREGVKALPFLWMVAPSHTYLLRFADFKKDYWKNEKLRYAIAQKNSYYHACLWPSYKRVNETIYYVTQDGLREVSVVQARQIVIDTIQPVVVAWIKEHEPVPAVSKISVIIRGISFSQLKVLIRDCRNHGDDSLMNCLKRLKNHRQVAKNHQYRIHYDEQYNEFSFGEYVNGVCRLCGVIKFHGWPESGYQTNGSVQLEPRYGWASHT